VKLEKVQPSPRLPTTSMFRNLSETNKLLKFAGKTIWQLKATLIEIWLFKHGTPQRTRKETTRNERQ